MADRFRRRRRRKEQVSDWQQSVADAPLEDVAAAAELAREAASPFGYARPAGELLARFGGDTADARRRATAALTLAGVVADPPLDAAQATHLVHLRRTAVDPAAMHKPVEPAPTPEPAAAPPAQEPAGEGELFPRRPSWAVRVAARHAPSGPVGREGRVRAGLVGLLALVALIVAVVLLRGAVGSPGGDRGGDLAPAVTETTAQTAPARAPPATTPAPAAAPRRPRTVRLRVVPSEPSYLCVADGAGRTLWEGIRTGPYDGQGPQS